MAIHEKCSEKLRRLGVGRPITRRDFIDGIAVTAAVAATPRVLTAGDPERTAAAPWDHPDYNPPTRRECVAATPAASRQPTRCATPPSRKPERLRSIRASITI